MWRVGRIRPGYQCRIAGVRALSQQLDEVHDVVVVGGGLVGATLAAAIADSPVMSQSRILVIDGAKNAVVPPNVSQGQYSNRCTALTPSTVAFYEAIGVFDRCRELHSHPYQAMQVWDACSPGAIWLDSADVGMDHMGVMVMNDVLQAAVNARLEEFPNVHVLRGASVESASFGTYDDITGSSDGNSEHLEIAAADSDFAVVTLGGGQQVKTRLLVGADGPNSVVRKDNGLESGGIKYDQTAVVATVNLSLPSSAEVDGGNTIAWQRFLPTGPVAILPLDDDVSSLVWSTSPDYAKKLVEMNPEEFVGELNAAMVAPSTELPGSAYGRAASRRRVMEGATTMLPPVLRDGLGTARDRLESLRPSTSATLKLPPLVGSVVPGSRASFPLTLSHASCYVRPRVALAGDAAHKVHPLAGQGLNLGIGDARRLAEAIEESVSCGLDPGGIHQLLPYERDRQRAVVPVLLATDVFKRLFSTANPVVSAIRGLGMQGTDAAAPLKQKIIKFAMG